MFSTCWRDVLTHFAGTEINLKTKVLMRLLVQAKLLCVQFLHDSFVEVSYEGCHKHEDGVLCHKRFWQAIPTKSVVHDIEETFLATQKIVELHDVSYI